MVKHYLHRPLLFPQPTYWDSYVVTGLFLLFVPQWLLILIFYRFSFSQGCVLRVLCRARLKKTPQKQLSWGSSHSSFFSLFTTLSNCKVLLFLVVAKFQSLARPLFFSVYDIIYVTFWKGQKYRDRIQSSGIQRLWIQWRKTTLFN